MWELLLFVSLLFGQLGRIELFPSVTLYFHDMIIMCFIMTRIPLLLKSKKKILSLPLFRPILFFTLLCFLSLCVNAYRFSVVDLTVGISYFLRFMIYAFLYPIIRLEKKPILYFMKWLFLLGVGYAVLGFIQLGVYPDLRNLSYAGWDPHYYRLFATLFDPNFMGIVLIISFLSGIYVWEKERDHLYPLIGLIGIFVAFLLTFSRSSYLAAVVAIIVYAVCMKQKKFLIGLIFLCLGIVFIPAIGGESTTVFRQVTAFARITNWQEGMQLFMKSPFFGYGFNMVRALPHNAPTLAVGTIARSTSGFDNSIVFVLVTTGLFGCITFLYMGSRLFLVGLSLLKKRLYAPGSVYISTLAGLLIHSMFLNTLFYPQIMILFWIMTGAVEKESITSRS